MKEFRDLSPLERTSFDLWIARAQEANPSAAIGRSGPIRPEGEATAVPLEESKSGRRYEVLLWPSGAVNGLRELA